MIWLTTTLPLPALRAVLRCAAAAGLTVRETDFSLTAVYGADEAFVTGTFAGLLPVASVDGRVIGACSAGGAGGGAVTARLQQLYAAAVDADVAKGR